MERRLKITEQQRQAILAGLRSKREAIVTARDRDANDYSSKWNDAREARARRLDEERDELDKLIQIINSPSGLIEW